MIARTQPLLHLPAAAGQQFDCILQHQRAPVRCQYATLERCAAWVR